MVNYQKSVEPAINISNHSREYYSRKLHARLDKAEGKAAITRDGESLEDAQIRERYGVTKDSWESRLDVSSRLG